MTITIKNVRGNLNHLYEDDTSLRVFIDMDDIKPTCLKEICVFRYRVVCASTPEQITTIVNMGLLERMKSAMEN